MPTRFFSVLRPLFESETLHSQRTTPRSTNKYVSPSLQLTGNRSDPAVNLDGNPSQNHVKIFSADAIRNHPQVRLTRGGMILIALLAGGDYDHVSAYATAVTPF